VEPVYLTAITAAYDFCLIRFFKNYFCLRWVSVKRTFLDEWSMTKCRYAASGVKTLKYV